MLTIFSTPKPFRGHFGIIQTNALQSWLRLHPACEIILFGNEEGTAETAACLGIRHIPRIGCNKWGTPFINSLFDEAQKTASNRVLCYVNADIILLSDFLQAIQCIHKRAFLMVGRRWNLKVDELLNFDDPEWEHSLRAAVATHGVLEKPDGLDYFVFLKGMFFDIPPFSVGRPGWDNWMIYRARYLGISVIDATPSLTAIHQIHDYSHHPQGKKGVWEGPEAEANLQLLDGGTYAFTLWDATRILKRSGLKLGFSRYHLRRRLETLAILYPKRTFRNLSLKILLSGLLRFYDLLVSWKEEMKSILKTILAKVDQRFPEMGTVIRRIYLRKPLNTVKWEISGKQNVIRSGNSILSSVVFDIKGDRNHVEIQDGCLLNGVTFFIRGDGHRIQIGKGCRFNRGGSLWFEDHSCSLIIGEGTTFEDVHIAVTERGSKVEIGEDCMFAYDIDIRTGDSHSIIDSRTGERLNFAEDIHIGKHVWVAAHSILLKGVSILDNSVVATGSVVTKSFEEKGVVIAGNPAEIVKRQIIWSRKRIYPS